MAPISIDVIRSFLFSILLLNSISFYAQNYQALTDSILKSVSSNNYEPEVLIDLINSKAGDYLKTKPRVTRLLIEESLALAEEFQYNEGNALAHYIIGTTYVYDQYDKALDHLFKSVKLASGLEDERLQSNALLSISIVYQAMDKNEKAIEYALKAQQIANKIKDLKILSRVHTNLSSFYYDLNQTASALKHSRIALELKKQLKDSYGIRLNYLNLGVFLAEYDSTLDEGIKYMQKARALSVDDPIMINDVMANMIWAYSQKANYPLSLIYLDSALAGSDTIENPYTLQAIHRLGKEVYLALSDYENAYIHSTKEYDLDNDLRGDKIESKFKILELENENYEKQQRILLLEKKRSEANLKLYFAILLAVLFLLLLVVVFKSYRLKNKLFDDLKIHQLEIQDKSHLLEIKNKEIEQFAYVASHDLKAPLNTIMSCINVLRDEIDEKLSDQAKQMSTFINTSANRMKSMIDSLLEHGRLGADIEFEEVDINKLIEDLSQDLSHLINETGTDLEVSYLPCVKGSKTELSLLFQNLITNGIKFSSNNENPKISISYKSLKKSRRHQFSIKDNGVGIPQNRQEKVFHLFERAHGKEFEGSGIGLAHCQKIVKLHKGSIWFDSEEGKGTTFHFVLPMKDWDNTDVLQLGAI